MSRSLQDQYTLAPEDGALTREWTEGCGMGSSGAAGPSGHHSPSEYPSPAGRSFVQRVYTAATAPPQNKLQLYSVEIPKAAGCLNEAQTEEGTQCPGFKS